MNMDDYPVGMRLIFSPTDEEFIDHYLRFKIGGADKENVGFIGELNVYEHEPWCLPVLSRMGSESNWFFFCPKYQNGQRFNRATKCGYWKAVCKDRLIKSSKGTVKARAIGPKKTLVFYSRRAPKVSRTNWVMHEYDATHPGQGAFVLCRLFLKHDEKGDDITEEFHYDEDEERNSMNKHANFNQEVEGDLLDCEKDSKAPTTNLVIKEKISNVLQNLRFPSYLRDILVQFWAPVTTMGRCSLATSDQPFSISNSNEGLCTFRNLSMDCRFYVDTESENELGIINHAFMQKSPNLLPDVQSCSSTVYPQLDHVVRCNVHSFVALPVLEPTNLSCVGVIELVLTRDLIEPEDYLHLILEVCNQLKAVDLKSSVASGHLQSLNVTSGQEMEEELSVEVVRFLMEKNIDPFQIGEATKSPYRTEDLQNGGGMIQLDSSFLQLAVVDDATSSEKEGKINSSESEHRKTETSISDKVLEGHFGMKLKDAAERIGVSRSKLKRLCRQNGISRWPTHKGKKVNHPVSEQDRPSSNPPPDKKMQDERSATIKAAYNDDLIKFQLSSLSGMVDLEEEVAKRLKLEIGTFRIKYMDEDSDWILIGCDADLKNCIRISTSLGTITIKMVVQPV